MNIPLFTKNLKRYENDAFVIINKNAVEEFLDHLNTIENSIKFTIKKQADLTLSFLDALIRRNEHGGILVSKFQQTYLVMNIQYFSTGEIYLLCGEKYVVLQLLFACLCLPSLE